MNTNRYIKFYFEVSDVVSENEFVQNVTGASVNIQCTSNNTSTALNYFNVIFSRRLISNDYTTSEMRPLSTATVYGLFVKQHKNTLLEQ